MNNKSTYIHSVVLTCSAGANISECALEAAALCIEERRRVEFTHNDKRYIIEPGSLVSAVLAFAEAP